MNIVDPCIPLELLPDNSRAQVIAENHPDYQALPSVITPTQRVITRWRPTDEERAAIALGQDIYVTMIAPDHVINPFYVTCGLVDWRNEET